MGLPVLNDKFGVGLVIIFRFCSAAPQFLTDSNFSVNSGLDNFQDFTYHLELKNLINSQYLIQVCPFPTWFLLCVDAVNLRKKLYVFSTTSNQKAFIFQTIEINRIQCRKLGNIS